LNEVMVLVTNEQLEKVKKRLIDRLNPKFILLFGSYARNTANDESDLDIAFYTETPLSNYDRFLLAGELATIINKDVDLVNLREVDTVFAALIFSSGELLYCSDDNTFYRERMKTLSMYATLNEQRIEILEAIEKRGSVYGEQ